MFHLYPQQTKKGRSLRKNDELSQEKKAELKRLTGKMMWASTQTQPNVAFDVCRMSNAEKFPKVKLLFKANKTKHYKHWNQGQVA